MMFLNISKYNSDIVSYYFKWFLIKRRNFLQFENLQYGSAFSGEILRKIMLSSMIKDGYLRLVMSYFVVFEYLWRRLRMWRTLIIDYGIESIMDLRNSIWPRRMGVSLGGFAVNSYGKRFVLVTNA
jgi:hypothetical protein